MRSTVLPARSASANVRLVARIGQWLLPWVGALIVSAAIEQVAEHAVMANDHLAPACGDQAAGSAPVLGVEATRTQVVGASSSGDRAYVRVK
jgi:hypothetical protein